MNKNGLTAFLDELFKSKYNIHYMGRIVQNNGFYFYLNKSVKKPEDMVGLKIRSAGPTYDPFIKALGMVPVTITRQMKLTPRWKGE